MEVVRREQGLGKLHKKGPSNPSEISRVGKYIEDGEGLIIRSGELKGYPGQLL